MLHLVAQKDRNMKPELSIIIPVYNCEKYIIRCLGSVLRQQDSQKYEIIVVNDGSTDNTATQLNKFAIKYKNINVIHQKNAGVSVARNVGISASRGKYVTFVDGDDMVGINAKAFDKYLVYSCNHHGLISSGTTDIPKKLTAEYFDKGYFVNMLNIARKTDADIVLGGYVGLNFDGGFMGPRLWRDVYDKQHIYKDTPKDKRTAMNAIDLRQSANFALYSRELLDKNKLQFTVNMQLDEDILFGMLAVLYAKKIATAPDVTYFYNRHDGTLSSTNCLSKYDIAYIQRFVVLLNEIAKMPKYESLFAYYTQEYVQYVTRHILLSDNEMHFSTNMYKCKDCECQSCIECPIVNDVLEHCRQSIIKYLSNSNIKVR